MRITKECFGLESFPDHMLWEYYRRLNVKYKRLDYRLWNSLTENGRLKEEIHEFVMQLGTIIKEIAYKRGSFNR